MDKNWNPWKVTALGLALVMATALITGLVVANWSGTTQDAAEQKAAVAYEREQKRRDRERAREEGRPAERARTSAAGRRQGAIGVGQG